MPLVSLAAEAGFPGLPEPRIRAWRRDLLDVLEAEAVCTRGCPGLTSCPWQGLRPKAFLDTQGVLSVRLIPCDMAARMPSPADTPGILDKIGIPQHFHHATLESFRTRGLHADNRKLKGEVLTALAEGHSLVLASDIRGNGKTHLGCAFARKVSEAGRRVRFVVVKDLLDAAKRTFDHPGDPDPFDQVQDLDVLVLDDLGLQFTRQWGNAEISGLINHRYNHQLQTVVTTNFARPADLAKSLGEQGERVISRLRDMGAWALSNAPDYRGRRHQRGLAIEN